MKLGFKSIFSILLIGVAALIVLAWCRYEQLVAHQFEVDSPLIVEVVNGDSFGQVLEKLPIEKPLYWDQAAKVYASRAALANKIKVGEFRLDRSFDLEALLLTLTSNKQILHRITLVEGSSIKEMRDVIASESKLESKTSDQSIAEIFERALAASSKRAEFDKLFGSADVESIKENPEGLFYPDTYFFHKADTDLSIWTRALDRMITTLTDQWPKAKDKSEITSPYEALILASIIEKETGVPSERGEIAGVFVRRLKKGMKLQTDPTVIYGLGDSYNGNITRAHLRQMTPYNTYRIPALPPTPIAAVGKEAIHAALNPKDGSTLFFVAKGDGSHYFSATLDEHNRAVRKYQLKRRADYRSTHQRVGN